MASSSSTKYSSNDNEVIPISDDDDEQYAQLLQLEEVIRHSATNPPLKERRRRSVALPITAPLAVDLTAEDDEQQPNYYCGICMDSKTESEMFKNTNVCSHMFCSDCIRDHVAAKIKENMATVRCPHPDCKALIGPQACKSINVPKQVLERWEDALCESLITGSQKYYCPFKDCSAMLVDDGGVAVTSSECPSCNRLFCAQCRVAWHCGMDCGEYKSLRKGERDPEDLMLMDLAKTKRWMRCPYCRFFVEKRSGCSVISCRCGHRFNYGW